MKKIKSLFGILALCTTLFSIASCKYDLIESPTRNENEENVSVDYKDTVFPPATLEASQGNKGAITITWQKVSNAVSYRIYEGDTPFEHLSLKTETSDTFITLEYEPGTIKYFSVTAINHFGTESLASKTIMGSVLAVPVITNIESNNPGEYKITWWMDNCNKDTYQNTVSFVIKAYKDRSETSQPCYEKEVTDGSICSVVITDLTELSKYFFEVEVHNGPDQKPEKSGKTDASSAKKIIPDAVKQFTASKGSSTTDIVLQWNLPEAVWYKADDYELHPVYFKLYRKLTTENRFTEIETIGAVTNDNWEVSGNKTILFDCESNKVFNKDGTEIDYAAIQKFTDGTTLKNQYAGYTSKSTFTYIDKNTERGKEYEYYVLSYTDDTIKTIPPKENEAAAKTEILKGYQFSPVYFDLSEEYICAEESTAITQVKVTFAVDYNPLPSEENTYKYIIRQRKTEFEDSRNNDNDLIIGPVPLVSGTKEYVYNLTSDDICGYYDYDLYIVTEDYSIDSGLTEENTIDRLVSAKSVTVVDDKTKLPEITTFQIEDGYKDRFILTWNYVENAEYTLLWYPVINGTDKTDDIQSLELNNNDDKADNDYTVTDSIVKFTHNASAGQIRKYALVMKSGLKTQKNLDTAYCTLGIPEPVFTEYNYDCILVNWKKIPGCSDISDFSVSAKYQGTSAELVNSDNTFINYDSENETFSCVINKPQGYNDYSKSGLPINLKVTAKNPVTNDTNTSDSCTVRTLGPAEITTSVNTILEKDKLTFSWTAAAGADKYLIIRNLYTDKDLSDIEQTDYYYVDAATLTVTAKNNQSTDGRTVCSRKDNTFTIVDYQCDAEDNYDYQYSQSKIQWGLPYSYNVLPLHDESHTDSEGAVTEIDYFNVFLFDDEGMSANSVVKYENFVKATRKTTNTIGYGINLVAAKSKNGESILIEWDKPNNADGLQPAIYRMPFSKPEDATDNTNWQSWKKINNLSSNKTSYSDKLPNENAHLAYLYAVEYEPATMENFVSSYIDDISKISDGFTEPDNKGYLFAIKGFQAFSIDSDDPTEDEYYQESIRWDPTWDFTERAICPDSFTVDIKNKNLSRTKNWISVANVTIDKTTGKFTISPLSKYAPSAAKDDDDLTVTSATAANGINVKPKSLVGTTTPVKAGGETDAAYLTRLEAHKTTGLLMVLRDTKHYYSLNITGNGNTNRQAKDESIYTYRQITETELVKCVSIIIADALYQAGIPTEEGAASAGSTNSCYGTNSSSLSITHVGWHNSCEWDFKNMDYQHKFRGGTPTDYAEESTTKEVISDIILYAGSASHDPYKNILSSGSNYCIKDYTLYYLPTLSIQIRSLNNLSSYEKRLTYTVGEISNKKYTLNISIGNSKFVSISNSHNTYIQWFPYEIGVAQAEHKTLYDSSLPVYSSPWWN